jgi:iron complex outermembrane receptor protein
MSSFVRVRRLAAPLVLSPLGLAFDTPLDAQESGQLDEIVVTGVPRDRAAGELAQSVTVVGGEELERVRASTLGETLAGQLGVSSSGFAAGVSRPVIRGLAGARVQMLEDGIATMDAATVGDDHAVTVEPLAAEQIEIFRGPTTLLYGSGAVGGVVNTVTARVPSRVPGAGLTGAAELSGDTAARAHAAAVRLDGGRSRLAWHFDAGRRDADDYEIPGFAHTGVADATGEAHGVLPNSAAESESAAFGASWLAENGFVGVGLRAFDTLYGVPGHHHEDEGLEEAEAPVRIDLEQRRLDLLGGVRGLSRAIPEINVQAGFNDYRHVELEGDAAGTRLTNDAAELRIELLHAAAGRWSGAFGAQLSERELAAIGEEAFVPSVDSRSRGLFVVEDVDLEPWQLSLGGRVETVEHRPANGLPAFDGTASSVSFGAVRPFAGYELVATLASAERVPAAEELYSNGAHLAAGIVQVGNVSLTEETARHLDVGVRGTSGSLEWSVTLFRTRYDGFIYLADTGARDPVTDLPVFAFAQAGADFAGAEAELFVPLVSHGARRFGARFFADYVRGELDGGEPLPRMPPLRVGTRFEYRNERLLAGVGAVRYAAQDHVAPFETETAGYTMVDADLRWRFAGSSGTELELYVNARNLGDEEARRHTSFVKDLAPLPGRNYAFGVRARF